jgi:hypothetical protein
MVNVGKAVDVAVAEAGISAGIVQVKAEIMSKSSNGSNFFIG